MKEATKKWALLSPEQQIKIVREVDSRTGRRKAGILREYNITYNQFCYIMKTIGRHIKFN